MAEFEKCLICGYSDLRPLKGYEKDFLVKCRKCSFVFCKRIPTNEELIEEYSTTYTRNDEISSITLKRYDEIFGYLEQFKKTKNILDVGAGNGHFIQTAMKYGWNAFGTEFDDRAVAICSSKGVTMHHGKLDPSNYKPGMFDIITSFEVLEHINNPIEEVENFKQLLRPGGLVYLTTPNVNSISHTLLKEKWTIFNYPEHLSYYTSQTIRKLFTEHGFSVRSLKTTGIGVTRIRSSVGVATGKATAISTESLRQMTEGRGIGQMVKKMINFGLDATGKGDKIKAEFTKR